MTRMRKATDRWRISTPYDGEGEEDDDEEEEEEEAAGAPRPTKAFQPQRADPYLDTPPPTEPPLSALSRSARTSPTSTGTLRTPSQASSLADMARILSPTSSSSAGKVRVVRQWTAPHPQMWAGAAQS